MELCDQVLDGLRLLNDQMGENELSETLSECALILRQSVADERDGQQAIERKLIKLSVCALALEAVKHNTKAESLRTLLTDNGVDDQKAIQVLRFYETIRDDLRRVLSGEQCVTYTAVVDCDWSEFCVIKTTDRETTSELNYVIEIKCDADVRIDGRPTGRSTLAFDASLPELQDLCAKLRDCCKVVDKVVNK